MKLITEEISKVKFITEEKNGKKNLYIEGIFLQADIKNRNGRCYPMETLAKEVSRYNENYISKGRALGELGHPCLSEDAKLLSESGGWKHIKNCEEGELVYTLNPQTKEVELHPIKKVVINDHNGIMYTIKNRGINTKVTPDHRFLIINSRNQDHKFVTAQEIYEDLNKENFYKKWYIPKYSLGLNKEASDTYQIEDLEIDFNTFAAFLAIYDSNGHRHVTYGITILQKKGKKADRIREVLNSIECLEWDESTRDDFIVWNCRDERLERYLEINADCHSRDFIENLNSDTARTFIDHFDFDRFGSTEKMIDDIAQIATIAGIGIERFIDTFNDISYHFCRFLNTKGVHLDNRFLEMTAEDWNDKVYCIQVENTNFMVEQNGYTYWTGNCGPTVNLDRVSHMITSLKENGNNFVGKAKILDTPMGKIASSLISEGVKLGVSSRGIGSLVERNGVRYVSDDFMLATAADIVADPSAPDAFVSAVMEDIDWIYDASKNEWVIQNMKKKIDRLIESRELEEKKIQLFDEFLNSL